MRLQSSKNVITNSCQEYFLTDEQLEKLHSVLLMMLKDIDFVAKKYCLSYFLSGGTLLGAVRHKGFIPWDDDIDLVMFRPDYDKIGEYIESEFGNKYEIVYNRSTHKDATCCLKIYLNGTKYTEVITECWKKPQKIFIDIFSIESAPNNAFVRKAKGILFNIGYKCAGLALEVKYPPKTLVEKTKKNKELNDYYKKRMVYAKIASIMPVKFWQWLSKSMICKYNPKSKLVHIPDGISYSAEVLSRDLFSDIIQVEYEGAFFNAPIGWQKYLENLYGDYMKIPPIEKRERHVALELDFGEY